VYADLNRKLAPLWKGRPLPQVRPATDPPRKGNVY
jgi:hypothetical protein